MPAMAATALGVAIVALQLYPYLLPQVLKPSYRACFVCCQSSCRESLLSGRAVGRSRYLTSFPHPYSGLTATPTDPDSVARFPQFPPDLSGAFSRNEQLAQHATRLFKGRVVGAESVAVAADGTLIMLDKYGYIHRAHKSTAGEYTLQAENDNAPPLQYIGPGRPLGFHVIENGNALLVCDSLKGLLRVDLAPASAITVLANSLSASSTGAGPQLGGNAHVINYANDLDVAKDGTVFFSSSTASGIAQHPDGYYDTMRSFLLNMCCGDHTGSFLSLLPFVFAFISLSLTLSEHVLRRPHRQAASLRSRHQGHPRDPLGAVVRQWSRGRFYVKHSSHG